MILRSRFLLLLFVAFIPATISAYYDEQECKIKNKEANELVGELLPQSDYDHVCIEALYIAFKYLEEIGSPDIKNPLKGYSYLKCKSYDNGRANVSLRSKEVPCTHEEYTLAVKHNPNLSLVIDIQSRTVEFEADHLKEINWILK